MALNLFEIDGNTLKNSGYTASEIAAFNTNKLTGVISLLGFGLSKEQAEVAFSLNISTQSDVDKFNNAFSKDGIDLNVLNGLTSVSDIDTLVASIDSGLSVDDASNAASSGVDLGQVAFLSQLHSTTQNSDLKDSISKVVAEAAYTAPEHQNALTVAATIAETFLRDVTITCK